jgi:1-acyl-sn-glycerol-3-phosphate acyltransferase
MFYSFVRLFFFPLVRIYLRLKTEGAEKVPLQGPALIAANHASFLDAIVLGSACPRRIHFVVLQSMYDWWRLRWFYWGMQTIPLRAEEADPRAVKQALARLRHGSVVGIYPEGGRSEDGRLQPPKPGAALLAVASGAPVIPAWIEGAWSCWRPKTWFPLPGRVRVVFGEPLYFSRERGLRRDRTEMERFSRRLMDAIAGLAPEGKGEGIAAGGGERALTARSPRDP